MPHADCEGAQYYVMIGLCAAWRFVGPRCVGWSEFCVGMMALCAAWTFEGPRCVCLSEFFVGMMATCAACRLRRGMVCGLERVLCSYLCYMSIAKWHGMSAKISAVLA